MDPIFNRQQKAKNQEVSLHNRRREISTRDQEQKTLARKEDGSLSWEVILENISMVVKKIPVTEMLKRTSRRIMRVGSAWTR